MVDLSLNDTHQTLVTNTYCVSNDSLLMPVSSWDRHKGCCSYHTNCHSVQCFTPTRGAACITPTATQCRALPPQGVLLASLQLSFSAVLYPHKGYTCITPTATQCRALPPQGVLLASLQLSFSAVLYPHKGYTCITPTATQCRALPPQGVLLASLQLPFSARLYPQQQFGGHRIQVDFRHFHLSVYLSVCFQTPPTVLDQFE